MLLLWLTNAKMARRSLTLGLRLGFCDVWPPWIGHVRPANPTDSPLDWESWKIWRPSQELKLFHSQTIYFMTVDTIMLKEATAISDTASIKMCKWSATMQRSVVHVLCTCDKWHTVAHDSSDQAIFFHWPLSADSANSDGNVYSDNLFLELAIIYSAVWAPVAHLLDQTSQAARHFCCLFHLRPLLMDSDNSCSGTQYRSCTFLDTLTQLSGHFNLVLVKLVQILMLY